MVQAWGPEVNPQHPHKNSRHGSVLCYSHTGEGETERFLGLLARQTPVCEELLFSEKPHLKKYGGQILMKITWGRTLASKYVHYTNACVVHAHTSAHAHTHAHTFPVMNYQVHRGHTHTDMWMSIVLLLWEILVATVLKTVIDGRGSLFHRNLAK